MRIKDRAKSIEQCGDAGLDYGHAESFIGVKVLDPIPTPPLPKTLADVEEGRCVKLECLECFYFMFNGYAYQWGSDIGVIHRDNTYTSRFVESLTDIWAVRCEVAE